MKTRIFVIVLFAAALAFGACSKKKSNACELTNFSDPANPNITWTFTPTTSGGDWVSSLYPSKAISGSFIGTLSPTFSISPKATVNVESGSPRDFSNGQWVSYVVTAEDGETKKTYRAQARQAD